MIEKLQLSMLEKILFHLQIIKMKSIKSIIFIYLFILENLVNFKMNKI
jgi:hypothetical protein